MKTLAFTLLACTLPLLAAPAAAQVNGTVFTTNSRGVPANLFIAKPNVYLAGGPGSNCSGNGLADGPYYFQVTDPSGASLLSSDSLAERLVVVSAGVIVSAAPGRLTQSGPCNSLVVQLAPFLDTPNAGDEYKVWLTPVRSYSPGAGTHGFLSEASKTDNFKVGDGRPPAQTSIHGTVFYDLEEDGSYNPAGGMDTPLPGWKVTITTGLVTEFTFTDQDGRYEFLRPRDGTLYELESVAPAPGFVGIVGGQWLPVTPIEVLVEANVPSVEVNFGNLFLHSTPEFARSKGYWSNKGEGELAACDPLWRETINELCLRTNFSNPTGQAGTLFTVSLADPFATSYMQLSDYLNSPANGVLAYILSVQYAAAHLNKSCGPLAGVTTYIDRLGDAVLVSFESMSAMTLMLLCDPRAANTGPGGDEEWRNKIMMCLNEWSGMNSLGDSIFTRREEAPAYVTPY